MKVLSLFDGMACGMLAFNAAGLQVDRYVAYEIDKYAVQTSSHNFPMIEHKGDVFHADFTEYFDFDFLVGGSPCTYWSIAQKNNRETEASGMGWELFSQYVRALHEAKPKFFIYENNKSMSKAIRQSITETFGFEPICINSALVSAQNRQRLYWVGRRNEDNTYSQVLVSQPKDKGIVLRDILESGVVDREKAYPLLTTHQGNARDYFKKGHAQIVCEPVGIGYRGRAEDGKWVKRLECNGEPKANAITTAQTDSMVCEPVRIGDIGSSAQAHRVYSCDGKSVTLSANGGGQGGKTGLYACPVNVTEDGKSQTIKATYNFTSIPNICCYSSTYGATGVAVQTDLPPSEQFTGTGKDRNAMQRVYEVKDGLITIKGKQYPIKLADGFYIIRKLTVTECKRLQTVPEWYEFPVSNAQAYKMLGNGWTVDVIAHLITSTQKENENGNDEIRYAQQLTFY